MDCVQDDDLPHRSEPKINATEALDPTSVAVMAGSAGNRQLGMMREALAKLDRQANKRGVSNTERAS